MSWIAVSGAVFGSLCRKLARRVALLTFNAMRKQLVYRFDLFVASRVWRGSPAVVLPSCQSANASVRVFNCTYTCQCCSSPLLLSRICACKRSFKRASLHVAVLPPLWGTQLYCGQIAFCKNLFRSFRLALKPPVQVKQFPNKINLPVSEHVLRGADLRVHAYYASNSGFADVCNRLN